AEPPPYVVEEPVEFGGRHARHAVIPLPFLPGPHRRPEARHPVDRRAPARRLAGEDAERQVAGRQEAVALEHPVERLRLALGEVVRRAVRTRFEADDAMAGGRETGADPPTAGPVPHYAAVRV